MAQLLTVFRPRPAVELTRPDSDESVEENLLEMNDSDQRQVEMRSAGSGVSENAAEAVARSEPDFNDYVNWVDSVQVTITAADVTALTNTVQSQRSLKSPVSNADYKEGEAYEFRRKFNVQRVSSDSYLHPNQRRRLIREVTPTLTCITPALQERWKKRGDDAFLAMISALYAKILIVMGLAFPMTEVISTNVTSSSYLAFYLYLYFGSILYFLYVFFALLWYRSGPTDYLKCFRKKEKTDVESAKDVDEVTINGDTPPPQNKELPRTPHHHGSFYLRIGAVVFGVGSMIYSGLEFAQYFEVETTSHCHDVLIAITPAARMTFTFIQMYFIFLNAKMTIYENRAIAYFGLMHLLATNMCIWLYVIIEETKHDVINAHDGNLTHHIAHEIVESIGATLVTSVMATVAPTFAPSEVAEALRDPLASDGHGGAHSESLQDKCRRSHMLGKLVHNASPFLFPCAIEYSLICAAIIYVMWKNVGIGDPLSHRSGSHNSGVAVRRSRHHYSVDCAKSNKGLFLGIFVLVMTLISLLMFFTLNNTPALKSLAITEVNAFRLGMLCMAFIAVLVGMYQVRELRFNSQRRLGLDEMLLVFGQSGVVSYNVFTIIAGYYVMDAGKDDESMLVLMAALAALFQAIAQTLFILDASRRNTYTTDQQMRKPGREVVTFLLVANFAMWTFNTLEKSRADVSINPIQLQFYGYWPWIIITNVSMPLAIFYRFHSTVVLCEIWKRCYKVKPEHF